MSARREAYMRPHLVHACVGCLLLGGLFVAVFVLPWLRELGQSRSLRWDGRAPIVGARPWREACSFRTMSDPQPWASCAPAEFEGCREVERLWEKLPPRRRATPEIYVEVGAPNSTCAVWMALGGADALALEVDPSRLFRLTSTILANRLRMGSVSVTRTLSAGNAVPINRRVRVMRVADHVLPTAAIQAGPLTNPKPRCLPRAVVMTARLLQGAMSLLSAGLVRSVVLEGDAPGGSLGHACAMLADWGYELWRGGAQLKSPAACEEAGPKDRVFALLRD